VTTPTITPAWLRQAFGTAGFGAADVAFRLRSEEAVRCHSFAAARELRLAVQTRLASLAAAGALVAEGTTRFRVPVEVAAPAQGAGQPAAGQNRAEKNGGKTVEASTLDAVRRGNQR
jgi:hypothetical protein